MRLNSQRFFNNDDDNFSQIRARRERAIKDYTYTVDMPEKQYRRRKKMFVLASATCVALYVVASIQRIDSNINGKMPIFGFIVIIPLILLCIGTVYGLCVRDMCLTRQQYMQNSVMIMSGGFLTMALSGISSVWHVVSLFNLPRHSRGLELIVMIIWFALTVISMVTWIKEVQTKYVVRDRKGKIIER